MLELVTALFIVAHRGASADAPENTIPAFELAWEQKADAIEGDFHLTKDGHIVCIHDYDTKRVSGEKHIVAETTLETLRTLDVGSWKSPKFAGTHIPTIDEVFETVPEGKTIYIEVKCGPEIVPALTKELEETTLKPSQIVVISFNEDFVRVWKNEHPHCPTMLLLAFDARRPQLKPSVNEVLSRLQACNADGLSSSEHVAVTPEVVDKIKDAGYQYHSWTIDETRRAVRSLNAGSQSITTNKPAQLRKELEAKMEQSPRG
ncbi:MAG: glycerophosphodiester phosphodiesterase [Verrucomicrobiota bacterium JB023]|nr:glycerophosphodiester phosphodiesterase [Verrucomicrobiota bacterium JB023]